MPRLVALALVLLIAFPAGAALDGRRLQFADGRLRDQRGREITLRGVNARVQGVLDLTFDDGRLPRLPINWSALAPAPGRYDRDYLARIAAVVTLCQRHGILVRIDFHQDAFAKEIGRDGAPLRVLDLLLGPGNYPDLGGPLDDLDGAPATLAAFRGSFANTTHTFDDAANTLRLRHRAAGRAPLELFAPPRRFPNGVLLRCDGQPVRVLRGAKDGILIVACGRGGGERLVELEPAP